MSRVHWLRFFPALLIIAALMSTLVGCGGGLSQADMMKNAIQRPDDDGDQAALAPAGGTTADVEASAKDEGEGGDGAGGADTRAAAGPPADAAPSADLGRTEEPADTAGEEAASASGESALEPPQTLSERRQWTIDNLTQISEALIERAMENRCFHGLSRRDGAGVPLLSWRVELLPYLGHEELYARFKLDQPWDSLHNRKLLSEIPRVYQSPERRDEKTNYLACAGSFALFREGRGTHFVRIEDGVSHTLMLVEVDDGLAVPWTKPEDYDVDAMQPMQGLGELREGYCFLAWADGRVAEAKAEDMRGSWRAMFTIDGGERFSANEISIAPSAEPPKEPDPVAPPVVPSEGDEVVALEEGESDESAAEAAADSDEMLAKMQQPVERKLSGPPPDWRQPVPTPNDREGAMQLLRATYYPQYEEAKTDEDKTELAARLIKEANTFQTDPVGRYVTLDLARKIAAEGGDLKTAIEAVEKILDQFQGDELALYSEVLATTSRRRLKEEENDEILDRIGGWIRLAIREERFDIARQIQDAALAAARRKGDRKKTVELSRYSRRIDQAEAARSKLVQSIGSVSEDPRDPESCTQAGGYYCFVKGRWEEGLALLVRGSDSRLAEVAEWELHGNDTLERRLQVADRWWELSESAGPYQHAMRQRAVFWYRDILPHLDPGLHRVKVELRLEEAGEGEPK